ncbi:MAG TPA: benzoate/H(+) symporter BenE family transporter [Pseudonocardiaceae bacterium]
MTPSTRGAGGRGRGDRTDLLRASTAGLIAAFVGFAGSFAIVLEGLRAVGASRAEAASGLMALCVAMGVCGVLLSVRHRMPISIAWSTPGAALLAASATVSGGFAAAVGAFLVASVLIVVAGLWRRLGRWVAAIPAPLANAMLAGVLLPLCLAPARAVADEPLLGLAVVLTWAVVGSVSKLYAMPAAVIVTLVLVATTTNLDLAALGPLWSAPVLVTPAFSVTALVGIALPLFVVTMASQNVPGIAVLNANGYRPEPGPLFSWTGVFGLLSAPFGGHAVNLAAITAALCAGEEAGADPRRRYRAAVVAGVAYVLLGLGAGAAVAFVAASPPTLIAAVAGLALLGALGGSLLGAVADPGDREAAVVTLVVTASGVTFFGIGGAFWGLLAGGALYAVRHHTLRRRARRAAAADAPGAGDPAAAPGSAVALGPADPAGAPVPGDPARPGSPAGPGVSARPASPAGAGERPAGDQGSVSGVR